MAKDDKEPRNPLANEVWVKQLLTRAERNPAVLDRARCRQPGFVAALLDHCLGLALDVSPAAAALTRAALGLAERMGHACLKNRSRAVLARVHVERGELEIAKEILTTYEDEATVCCRICSAEHYSHSGALLVRSGYGREALTELTTALSEYHNDITADRFAWVMSQGARAWKSLGDRTLAVSVVSSALASLSIDSPLGKFRQLLLQLPEILAGGDSRDDELALKGLVAFSRRTRRRDRFQELRPLLSHVEGYVRLRLGHVRRGRRRLEKALSKYLGQGEAEAATALLLELAQLRCRRPRHQSEESFLMPNCDALRDTKRMIRTFRDSCPGLSEQRRAELDEVLAVLEDRPEDAFSRLGRLRESLALPLPALLGERIGPPVP